MLASSPLIQVRPGLMIWTIVCFAITYFVLRKYASTTTPPFFAVAMFARARSSPATFGTRPAPCTTSAADGSKPSTCGARRWATERSRKEVI